MTDNYLLQQKYSVQELETSFCNGSKQTSIVEIQNDYANDRQTCLTSVAFIPQDTARTIDTNILNKLKDIEPQHYYYPLSSLHLTIKNIRTIHDPPLYTELEIHKVGQLFSNIIPQFSTFDFTVEDVLIFPTSISIMAYSDNTLQKIVFALNEGLRKIGVPDNKIYYSKSIFWGNITICRFVHIPHTNFLDEVRKMRHFKIGKFKVETISLIICNAVCQAESRTTVSQYRLKNKELL